jgi:hypothetical protein
MEMVGQFGQLGRGKAFRIFSEQKIQVPLKNHLWKAPSDTKKGV